MIMSSQSKSAAAPSRSTRLLKSAWGTLGPLMALVCVVLLLGLTDSVFADGTFLRADNLRTVTIQTCVVAVAALGMTVIIIAGGIDLSVGTALALSATILALGVEKDVAFMAQYGDNFAGASQKLDEAQKKLAEMRQAGENQQIAIWQEEVKRRNAWLLDIAKVKLDATRSIVASAGPPAAAARRAYEAAPDGDRKTRLKRRMERLEDEQLRWRRNVVKTEQKIAKLADLDFRPSSDFEWHIGIPNSSATAPLAVALGIAMGMLAGLLNGLLISGLRVVPFIVTLGTMTIFVGAGNWISGNKPIRPVEADQVPFWLQDMVSNSTNALWFNTFPTGVWLVLVLAVIVSLILRYTVFGRYVFALGSNEATARLCGVNVPLVKISLYTLAGVLIGIAGVCHFATESTGNPSSGLGLELKIIAAVVIGGGSLSGGRGSVLGTLAGAAIMQVIDNGCTHLELDVSINQIVLGAIIISAVTIDQIRQRRLFASD